MKKIAVLWFLCLFSGLLSGASYPQYGGQRQHPNRTQDGRGPDGRYHDPRDDKVQPDMCDNGFKNEHPCNCDRTKMCDADRHKGDDPGNKCQTYCRKDACRCIGASCS